MLAETEEIISLKNIDKSGWKTYRFDEIARNISERVDPNNTDLDVYIGLEHLDSDSIHIRRFGKREDVNGQKLRFYPGDVIFGRRRAYQRKAGVAETEGFCSAHALVLRANPDLIDPSLFPFFIHSDAFMHRAVDISVGSLSPTINWGALKKQEFLLPPRKDQSKLSELFWAIDDFIETQYKVIHLSGSMLQAYRKQHFGERTEKKFKLGTLASIRSGSGFPMKYQGHKNKELMFFKVSDMNSSINQRGMYKSEHTVSQNDVIELKAKPHSKGTVIFPKVGAAIATEKKRLLAVDAMIDNNVMGVTINEEKLLTPEYLLEYMLTVSLQNISNAGAVPSINAATIKELEISIPSRELLDDYLSKINQILETQKKSELSLARSNLLKKAINYKVF